MMLLQREGQFFLRQL